MVSTIVSNHLEQKYNKQKNTFTLSLCPCQLVHHHISPSLLFLLPPNGGQKIISLHRRRFLGAWGGSLSTVTCRFLTSGILMSAILWVYPPNTTQDASHKWKFRLGFPILNAWKPVARKDWQFKKLSARWSCDDFSRNVLSTMGFWGVFVFEPPSGFLRESDYESIRKCRNCMEV